MSTIDAAGRPESESSTMEPWAIGAPPCVQAGPAGPTGVASRRPDPIAPLRDHNDAERVVGVLLRIADIDVNAHFGLITKCISDPDSRVRGAAVYALGRIGGLGAICHLTRLLLDPDPYVRLRVVRAIGELRGDPPRELLRSAAGDPDARVSRAAVEILLDRGDREAAPLLDGYAFQMNALLCPAEYAKLRQSSISSSLVRRLCAHPRINIEVLIRLICDLADTNARIDWRSAGCKLSDQSTETIQEEEVRLTVLAALDWLLDPLGLGFVLDHREVIVLSREEAWNYWLARRAPGGQ